MLQVPVRLNGVLAREAGVARFTVEMPPGSNVGDLIARLSASQPVMAGALGRCVAVVDGRHVDASHPLADAREVALLMPVAGGDARWRGVTPTHGGRRNPSGD